MDFTATLNEIKSLSIEERIRFVQAIWDSKLFSIKIE
jgi:hypothetical protein